MSPINPPAQRVLVTGAAGQDGAYLCRDLLAQGHHVFATIRPGMENSVPWRWIELGLVGQPRLECLSLDVVDAQQCDALVAAVQPDQVFHLAARSGVAAGHADPQGMFAVNAGGSINLLDALRRSRPQARFIFASSSEIYDGGLVDEASPARARHPYALSKLAAHETVRCYRESFRMAASSAILFNHESPLRGAGFVTRKIAAAAVAAERGGVVALGNLDAQRDFGYAPEYVAALAAMGRQDLPGDYVLATGVLTSIRQFCALAFSAAGIELAWEGGGVDERGVDSRSGRSLLRVDAALWRPCDEANTRGNSQRARQQLGFDPRTDVAALARLMVLAERHRAAAALPSASPI